MQLIRKKAHWVGECSLREAFPYLFRIASDGKTAIVDLWVAREEEGSWSLLFRRHFQDWELGIVMQFMELT